MFLGNVYFWCINVSNLPLGGIYGVLCCMLLVRACVLLKINLYCENSFLIYFMNLVAIIYFFYIMLIARFISSCLGCLMMRYLGNMHSKR